MEGEIIEYQHVCTNCAIRHFSCYEKLVTRYQQTNHFKLSLPVFKKHSFYAKRLRLKFISFHRGPKLIIKNQP